MNIFIIKHGYNCTEDRHIKYKIVTIIVKEESVQKIRLFHINVQIPQSVMTSASVSF